MSNSTVHLRHKECIYPNPFYGAPACNVLGIGNPKRRRTQVAKSKQYVTCKLCLKMGKTKK